MTDEDLTALPLERLQLEPAAVSKTRLPDHSSSGRRFPGASVDGHPTGQPFAILVGGRCAGQTRVLRPEI